MPFDLKEKEDVKLFLENLAIEYRFACFKEKKPDGCHLLGDYLEAIDKDFRRAAQVYKDNCDERSFGHSCYKYGMYAYVGRGTPEDRAKSFEYLMKACDAGYPKGCFMSGLHLTDKKAESVPLDIERGVSLLKRACELDSPEACHHISGIYLTGKEPIAQNMTEAFRFGVKACDLGNMYACSNVALMYDKGMGVEKDPVMAKKYRSIAIDYRDQLRSNRGLSMEEGTGDV